MPHYYSNQQTNNSSINNVQFRDADAHALNLLGFVIISLPLFLLLGITAYKKYRTVVLRRQILFLEKIWLMEAKNNTYRQD